MFKKLLILATLAFTGLTFAPSAIVVAQAADSSNIVVSPIPGPSGAEKLKEKARSSWPWYVTRASGLIAAILLFILMLSGIGLITGHSFKLLDPLIAWASHKALGIAFIIAIVLHMFALLFDKFAPFSIANLLIPFSSDYKSVTIGGVSFGSLYIALGVIAFWAVLAIVLTSLLIINKKPNFWRTVHYLSYLAMAAVFFHALFIGTDLAHGIFRYIWIAGGLIILVAVLIRLKRAKTL